MVHQGRWGRGGDARCWLCVYHCLYYLQVMGRVGRVREGGRGRHLKRHNSGNWGMGREFLGEAAFRESVDCRFWKGEFGI